MRGKPISEAGTCRVEYVEYVHVSCTWYMYVLLSPRTSWAGSGGQSSRRRIHVGDQSIHVHVVIARKRISLMYTCKHRPRLSLSDIHVYQVYTRSRPLPQVKETPPEERTIEDKCPGLGLIHKIWARDDITTPVAHNHVQRPCSSPPPPSPPSYL